MSATAQKVLHLATLATNAGATDGEARNAAIACCRLIVQAPARILALVTSSPHEPERRVRYEEPAQGGRRVIAARYEGFCSYCAAPHRVGDRVAWAKGRGAICVRCHHTRAGT